MAWLTAASKRIAPALGAFCHLLVNVVFRRGRSYWRSMKLATGHLCRAQILEAIGPSARGPNGGRT